MAALARRVLARVALGGGLLAGVTIAPALAAGGGDPAGWFAEPVTDAGLDTRIAESVNRLRQRAFDCGDPLRVASALPVTLPVVPRRPALVPHPALQRAAQRQAQAMAATMRVAHLATDGTTVRERAREAGYAWRIIGENLAAGQRDVAEVVAQWFASPSHCDNLLDPRFTEFGVARIAAAHPTDPHRHYWALVLGARRGAASVR
ncbi:MAG: CAP domain-containing protein [Lautropia sp.]